MPVEDGSEQLSPPVSPLLAMGTGPRFNYRWLVGICIASAFVLSMSIVTLLFSGSISLPANTFFVATTSPRIAHTLLSQEQQTSLPLEWQRALISTSRWPVLFGLAGTRSDVHAFVIGPRWIISDAVDRPSETHGLIRILSPSLDDLGRHNTSTTHIVYRETFFDFLFHKGALQGWMNPSSLFPTNASPNILSFSLRPKGLLVTDSEPALTSDEKIASNTSFTSAPAQADVSIHLSALNRLANTEGFLQELPLAPLTTTLSALQSPPSEMSLLVSTSSIQRIHLHFSSPLSELERAALQSSLDQKTRSRLLTLPDGTTATELIPAYPSSQDDPTQFQWPTSVQPFARAQACSDGVWIARFSPTFLERIASVSSRLPQWIPTRAVQVWRTEEGLLICLE